jgi:hypothetical protein
MSVTVIIGPMYMQGNWGVGSAGPAEPWAYANGFAFDDNGDPIRDGSGNAIQILADTALSATDSTGSGIRDRLETSFASSLTGLGVTDTPVAFSWSESLF